MKDYQTVKLKHDIPEFDLKAGDSGIVVDTYKNGSAYEVEFFTKTGRTKAVLTLKRKDVVEPKKERRELNEIQTC